MKLKFLGGMAVVAVLSVGSLSAQHVDLNWVLYRSVTERVQLPLVFSTRDSLFALSLPPPEEGPAEVYVQVTLGRGGRVKEKKTRVNANHVGQYVSPAFVAATKGLYIDRDSVPALSGRDTSVLLTFPLEYCHVADTMIMASRNETHLYHSRLFYDNVITSWWNHNRKFREVLPGITVGSGFEIENPYISQSRLPKLDSYSGRIGIYLVFLGSLE